MSELKKGMVFDCVFPVIYGINGGQPKQPCVIVQSFKYNSEDSKVIVCPIIPAASVKEEFGNVVFHHEDSNYAIIVSNPITIQVSQLTTFLYRLEDSIVSEINKSLRLVFGIQPMQVMKADSILQTLQVVKQEIMNAIISLSPTQDFSSLPEACQENSSGIKSNCIIPEKESSSFETSVSSCQLEPASSPHTAFPPSPKTESTSSTQASVVPEEDEELLALAKYLAGETEELSCKIEKPPKRKRKSTSGIRIRWTEDTINQFLTDCNALPSHAIAEKCGMTVKTVSMNKSRLKKMRQERKK